MRDAGAAFAHPENLKRKEIPSCFFRDVGREKPTPDRHEGDYAALVEKARRGGRL